MSVKKRSVLFAGAILAAVLLTACGSQTPVPTPTPSPSSPPSGFPAPEPTPEPVLAEEPPLMDWAEEQPVPEFLDEEQQNLLLRAYSAAGFLMGCSTGTVEEYPLADGSLPALDGGETVTLDNGWTYRVAQGRYARWDDFQAMLDGIFTPEYQQELLWQESADGERIAVFTRTEDGGMCFIQADRGSDLEYDRAGIPDTYELVSQSEEELVFLLVGHYAVLESDGRESEPADVTTRTYPIRMERTDAGWRVAEFHVPY